MYPSIVIALYNEKENAEKLTQRLISAMRKLSIDYEIIYIIDGNDGTYELLKSQFGKDKNIKQDHHENPRGFRNPFVKGFELVSKKATHVLTMDGDLNHLPEEIKNFIVCMKNEQPDIIIGSRYIQGGSIDNLSLTKRMISKFANRVMKIFWKIDIKDKTSGYRLYKSHIVKSLYPLTTSSNFEFLFEVLILAKKKRYTIKEIPITFIAREKGESKFVLWKVCYGYIKLLLRHR